MSNQPTKEQHYVYYALGLKLMPFSAKCFAYGFIELSLQGYIGVRTGVLPDAGYKTSSTNSKWLYTAKVPIECFATRQEANDAELELLLACKETCWATLANRGIHFGGFTYGCKHSADTRAKLSLASLGRKHSAETRAKIGLLSLGNKHACYKHTEAHNKAISKGLQGRIFTDEHKAKLSNSAKGRQFSRQTVIKSQLGHKISDKKRAEFEQELIALQTGIACDLLEAPLHD